MKFIDLAKVSFLLSIAGCAAFPQSELPDDPKFAPVVLSEESRRPVSVGSLFQSASESGLYGDRRAYRVGDIITVMLNERTVSSKSAETRIDKDAQVDFGDDTVLGNKINYKGSSLLTQVDQQRGFDGLAEVDQENRLQGSVAVTVANVLPNGLLLIRGEKWMTLTDGREFIRISGLVRPDDISSSNTIASTKVADARISYSGTGALADANRQGWLSRFFNSTYWPF